MTDVQTNFKESITCGCGCGLEGRPRTKRNRDKTFHTRDCTCRSCEAGQYVKDEKKRVRKFATKSGLFQQSGSGRRIGYDLAGVCAVEETSHASIVRHLKLWWATVEVQQKIKTVRRQKRLPWALAASWDDKVQLVVTDAESFSALCLAACGQDMELALQLVDQLLEVTFPPCETAEDAQ